MIQPPYDNEALGRRGEEIYEQQIRSKVEDKYEGKILAIDLETGDYEIDDEVLPAIDRIHAKNPGVPVYTMRIGYDAVEGFGGGPRRLKR
jgi:hypothetical protein